MTCMVAFPGNDVSGSSTVVPHLVVSVTLLEVRFFATVTSVATIKRSSLVGARSAGSFDCCPTPPRAPPPPPLVTASSPPPPAPTPPAPTGLGAPPGCPGRTPAPPGGRPPAPTGEGGAAPPAPPRGG